MIYTDLKRAKIGEITIEVDKWEHYQDYVKSFVDDVLTQRERDFIWCDYLVERITGNKNVPHIDSISDFQKPTKNKKSFKFYITKPSTIKRFQGIYYHFATIPEFKKRFEDFGFNCLLYKTLGATPNWSSLKPLVY